MKQETLCFSANQALFLGSLSCDEIYRGDENDATPCDLSTEFEITEGFFGQRRNVLLVMKIELKPDGTDIPLSHPVLIQPGLSYHIPFGPFPANNRYYRKNLMKTMQLEPDINVRFLYGPSLISVLNFNKV